MLYGNNIEDLSLIAPKAYRFLKDNDPSALSCGPHDLGDGDFANVIECTTRPRANAVYESHVSYLDVQVVLSGSEVCEVAPLASTIEVTPYDAISDIAFQSGETAGTRYMLTPGTFLVLDPADAHMPTLCLDAPAPERKIVFKLRVSSLLRA